MLLPLDSPAVRRWLEDWNPDLHPRGEHGHFGRVFSLGRRHKAVDVELRRVRRGVPTVNQAAVPENGRPGKRKDVLKLAGKIELEPGEKLVGSDKVSGDFGTVRMALVDHGGHKSLRLGIGGPGFGSRDDEAGPWRGGPDRTAEVNAERKKLQDEQKSLEDEWDRLDADPHADPKRKAAIEARLEELDGTNTADVFPGGYTANLDPRAAEHLQSSITAALDDGEKVQATVDSHFDEIDRLEAKRDKLRGMRRKWTDEEDKLWDSLTAQIEALQANLPKRSGGTWGDYFSTEGSVPGQWADVHYAVYLDDPDPAIGLQVKLAAVPHGSGRNLSDLSDDEQAATLDPAETKKFLRLLDQYATADGTGKPATAVEALFGYSSALERLLAAETSVADVKGAEHLHAYWPGADLNRVAHGQPPRGQVVGPG
jgi:hypothetical protein